MPMIGGLRKKVRNSGEIATWDVHAVYENDAFDFELGDDPYIKHKPALGKRGRIVAVYSVATLKGGEKSRDVMTIEEVEAIRAKSRSAKGPWSDPTFYPEMAKKTVARRHAKVLPMSSDLDDLIRRDDALYDLDADTSQAGATSLASLTAKLQAIATPATATGDDAATDADPDTGQVIEAEPATATGEPETVPDAAPPATAATPNPIEVARQRGAEAQRNGMARRAVPGEYREPARQPEAEAWLAGFDAAKAGAGSSVASSTAPYPTP
jgi:recombination protein RecT